MAEQIGIKIGEWLYFKEVIQKEQIDNIRYAFEILCSEFLQLAIMITYGITMGNWVVTIVYLLLFHILRSNFQGYHAKTIWKCFILTIGSYLFTMTCYTDIRMEPGIIILMMLLPIPTQIEYCKKLKQSKPIIVLVALYTIGIMLLIMRFSMYLQVLLIVNILISVALLPKRKERI